MAGFLPRLFSAVLPRVRAFSEMGVSGTPVYAGYVLTPERSHKLVGQEKYRTYSEILANTSIVAAGTRYFLNIIAKPSWNVEPADQSDEAKQLAEFVEDVFDSLHTPWGRIVRRAGTYRFHGFNIQEWTACRRDDGKIGFQDIETRPQWTIWRWEVDEQGAVIGAWQRDPLTGRELGLPRGKIMYIVDDTITDSPEGMGLLRHCVEPAQRLEEYLQQEGFGFLRDLHGVPLGRAPIDELQQAVTAGKISKADMDAAIEKLRKFVSMEKKSTDTAIILNSQPYQDFTDSGVTVSSQMKWGVELINGGAPGLQQVGEAIVRLNTEMARILGVEHLLLGADSAGSYALAKEKATDLYLLANSVIRDIATQAQHDLLEPLWSLNGFDDKLMPKLKPEDVQPRDAEQIARVMRDLATAGAMLQPDDEVQNFVRDLLGAPNVDLKEMQARMMEEQKQNIITQEQQNPPFGGKSPGQQAAAEDKLDAKDAKQQALVQKILIAKEMINVALRKSTNGVQGKLRSISDDLDAILAKADWDESKHPRGEHGRWSAQDFAEAKAQKLRYIFYHGTSKQALEGIRKDGLVPAGGKGAFAAHAQLGGFLGKVMSFFLSMGDRKASVYMTSSPTTAETYAQEVAKATGADPLVLRVRFPVGKYDQLVDDPHASGGVRLKGEIPPQWIDQYSKEPIREALPIRGTSVMVSGPHFIGGSWKALRKDASSGEDVAYVIVPVLNQIEKVIPYAEAAPYRHEDEFIAGQSGTPDGHHSQAASYSPSAGARRGGPDARGMKGPGAKPASRVADMTTEDLPAPRSGHRFDGEAPISGDDAVPGARLRTNGRPRVV